MALAQWPLVGVSENRFAAYVAERALDVDLIDRFGLDLYLACACANGDQHAMAILEEQYFASEIDAPCRRTNVVTPEEMRQRVRTKLFVGPSPRIAAFGGRSSLRSWLRAVVSRLVIDAARERPAREVPADDDAFSKVVGQGDDPDRRLVKETYQEALEAAFVQAASGLDPRMKNILRYALAEGLTIDQIGAIYGVHRVTAHRWIQQAKELLAEQIRAGMMARLRMSASEYSSVVRLVMSQFDVTMARVFRAETAQRA